MMKMKINHGIILANMAVIGLAIVSYMGLSSTVLVYPPDGTVTDDRTPVFRWSGMGHGYELLIDDDPGFGTPMVFKVHGNRYTPGSDMEFGTYWWKVRRGGAESSQKKFTLVSTVSLSRLGNDMIINSGNTGLHVYGGGLAGAVTLAVNGSMKVREEGNVRAEQE